MRNKEILDKLEAEFEKVMEAISELNNELNKNKLDKKNSLHLLVEDNGLTIKYGSDYVGFIYNNGECYFLASNHHRETREKWIKDGRLIDHTPVEWKGDVYSINSWGVICNGYGSEIYSFKFCIPRANVNDNNILRYEDNGTPILFS